MHICVWGGLSMSVIQKESIPMCGYTTTATWEMESKRTF
jgi:hypothetical protein